MEWSLPWVTPYFAPTRHKSCLMGEKAEITPNNFKGFRILPAKAQWKAASDNEVMGSEEKQRLRPLAGDLCPHWTQYHG